MRERHEGHVETKDRGVRADTPLMSGCVLVVEPNASLRTFVAAGLRAEGYRVDTTSTWDGAVVALGERPYDVVLVDVMATGLGSVDVVERVHAAGRPDARVVLTAPAGPAFRALANRAASRAAPVVDKPFTVEELLGAIRAV